MHIASVDLVLCWTYFFTACSDLLWMRERGLSFLLPLSLSFSTLLFSPLSVWVLSLLFPSSSLLVCVFSPKFHLYQSIFMFPLSFSSSSSLSSIPPSLDSISELERGLSDISEDDDVIDDATASHTPWALPSNTASPFSDQQLADLERLTQNPQASCPITSPQTHSSDLLGVEEGCWAETRATAGGANWWSWFSLRGVVKCVSFVLLFLSLLGKNATRCLPTKLLPGLTKKLSFFSPIVSKLRSAGKLKIFAVSAPRFLLSNMTTPMFRQIRDSLALKWAHLVGFITSDLPTKFISFVPAVLWHPTQLHFPSVSSLTCPLIVSTFSSLPSLSSLPSSFFSVPPPTSVLSSLCSFNLPPSVHRYLLNPSPLFLPCLLVVFLLVVMLTASQSLVLALILATPLGLTLCYLENVVSSQRKLALLPVFVSDAPSDHSEDQLSSGLNKLASPPTPTHTPPRIRHHAHTSATWTQEMCDPAAWTQHTTQTLLHFLTSCVFEWLNCMSAHSLPSPPPPLPNISLFSYHPCTLPTPLCCL